MPDQGVGTGVGIVFVRKGTASGNVPREECQGSSCNSGIDCVPISQQPDRGSTSYASAHDRRAAETPRPHAPCNSPLSLRARYARDGLTQKVGLAAEWSGKLDKQHLILMDGLSTGDLGIDASEGRRFLVHHCYRWSIAI